MGSKTKEKEQLFLDEREARLSEAKKELQLTYAHNLLEERRAAISKDRKFNLTFSTVFGLESVAGFVVGIGAVLDAMKKPTAENILAAVACGVAEAVAISEFADCINDVKTLDCEEKIATDDYNHCVNEILKKYS